MRSLARRRAASGRHLRRFPFATMALCASVASTAAAEKFPVDGAYGNPAGCRMEAGGGADSEDMLYLSAEHVGTYATLCMPLAIWPAGGSGIVAAVICGHEGDEAQTVDHVRLVKADDGRDAWVIYGADGTRWGEASRC